jgi:hypothetical protein
MYREQGTTNHEKCEIIRDCTGRVPGADGRAIPSTPVCERIPSRAAGAPKTYESGVLEVLGALASGNYSRISTTLRRMHAIASRVSSKPNKGVRAGTGRSEIEHMISVGYSRCPRRVKSV